MKFFINVISLGLFLKLRYHGHVRRLRVIISSSSNTELQELSVGKGQKQTKANLARPQPRVISLPNRDGSVSSVTVVDISVHGDLILSLERELLNRVVPVLIIDLAPVIS